MGGRQSRARRFSEGPNGLVGGGGGGKPGALLGRHSTRAGRHGRNLGNNNHSAAGRSSSGLIPDPFFLRSIAKSLREYDLEQKIELEIKMREGTKKLLAACKHQSQTLEAAKSLLTSDERMAAYTAELQRRRGRLRSTGPNSGGAANGYRRSSSVVSGTGRPYAAVGRVAVSDIRVPLMWKDVDHFKNRGDHRRFGVFALLRIGTEIYDTAMVNVDRNLTDLTFEDIIVFGDVQPDFEFRLEVYCTHLTEDLSMASTPRRFKKKISSSVSKALGKRLAATLTRSTGSSAAAAAAATADEWDTDGYGIPERFELIASSSLRLRDTADGIRSHDLTLENVENRQAHIPLFGHYCIRLAAAPNAEEKISGYLRVSLSTATDQNTETTLPASQTQCPKVASLYWASLKNFSLHLYEYQRRRSGDQRNGNGQRRTSMTMPGLDTPPDLTVPITGSTRLCHGPGHLSFTLISPITSPSSGAPSSEALGDENQESNNVPTPPATSSAIKLILSPPDRITSNQRSHQSPISPSDVILEWIKSIEQHIEDHMLWGEVAAQNMTIPSPSAVGSGPSGAGRSGGLVGFSNSERFARPRVPGQLYDEIPISDIPLPNSQTCPTLSNGSCVGYHSSTLGSTPSRSKSSDRATVEKVHHHHSRLSPPESLRSRSSTHSSASTSDAANSLGSAGSGRVGVAASGSVGPSMTASSKSKSITALNKCSTPVTMPLNGHNRMGFTGSAATPASKPAPPSMYTLMTSPIINGNAITPVTSRHHQCPPSSSSRNLSRDRNIVNNNTDHESINDRHQMYNEYHQHHQQPHHYGNGGLTNGSVPNSFSPLSGSRTSSTVAFLPRAPYPPYHDHQDIDDDGDHQHIQNRPVHRHHYDSRALGAAYYSSPAAQMHPIAQR